jgi:hypothetical protein
MRRIIGKTHAAVAALSLCLLMLPTVWGCAPESGQGQEDRVSALETEMASLRQELRARDGALRDELALFRTELTGLREALRAARPEAAPDGAGAVASKQEAAPSDPTREKLDRMDDELDVKAKTFVSESLDRLLDITKKILDRMDRELEHQNKTNETGEPDSAAPKGDAI